MRYVTAAEMKEIDRHAIEDRGIPAGWLMENAGKALALEAESVASKKTASVFCGYGNNGGDGLVAARQLIKKAYKVEVFIVGKPKTLTPETNSNLEKLFVLKITPRFIADKSEIKKIFDSLDKPGVVVDAIFGIGIKGALDDLYIEAINRINALGAPIVSADIPSGLDADTGLPLPVAVKAQSTVTFGYPKEGFKDPGAKEFTGKVIVADIGLPGTGKIEEGVVRVKKGKKGVIRLAHPWIFKNQIDRSPIPDSRAPAKPGDIVTVQGPNGEFIGRGYYNPRSEIAVRLITFKDEAVDKKLFDERIRQAKEKRCGFGKATNAYRVVFSEADSLPGLIIDMYAGTAVFQVLTLGMSKLKSLAVESIQNILKPKFIYEKSISPFGKIEGLKDFQGWWGPSGETIIEIFEGKAKFLVDIEHGHKTGFYLDQRKSRLGLEGLCHDKTVLDLFCYTGGFAVSAALYGARHVTGVDIKEEWLALARENARLNDGVAERSSFMKNDAFAALKDINASGRKYDVIILDPPSFLKTKDSVASASKGYKELNTMAMAALSDGGILATFSCSHNMPNKIFSDILKASAAGAKKEIAILKRCHQDKDHPIARAIPETEYLKGYFLKMK
jgi:23S rRNA (cytosine1962-C5)-methyltransferase